MITAIDPDLRKSGVCQINNNGEIIILKSMTIYELIQHISNNYDIYVIEDVNKIKAMYSRGAKTNNTKIAQNVGMCKAAGTIIGELVTAYNGHEPILAPVGLGKPVKSNSALFKCVSGWTKTSNEDMRDAWAIAYWQWAKGK